MAPEGVFACGIKSEDRALRFIRVIDGADRFEDVQRAFQELVEPAGFTSFTCAAATAAGHLDSDGILLSATPAGWLELYLEQGYFRADPIMQEMFRSRRPLVWSEAVKGASLSRRRREVLRRAAEFGMRDGLIVPIRESGGNVGFVNLAGASIRLPKPERDALVLASVFLYQKLCALRAIAGAGRQPLTPREAEILHWVAEGKSDWETGRILAISSKTVNYHIENVKRKFGVSTRTQAVVSAIHRGELTYRPLPTKPFGPARGA